VKGTVLTQLRLPTTVDRRRLQGHHGERPAGVKARWGGGRAFSRLIRTSRIMVSLYERLLGLLGGPRYLFSAIVWNGHYQVLKASPALNVDQEADFLLRRQKQM
jgi:hypothetical protein